MDKELSQKRSRGGYLEALLNSCPEAILAINAEGIITFANKAACELSECEMQHLVGENIAIVYESLKDARETNRKLYEGGGLIQSHESKFKTRTGKIIPIRISASHLKDSAGNYIGAVGYFERYRPWGTAEARVKAYADELETQLKEWKDVGAPVFQLYPRLSMLVIDGNLDVDRCQRIGNNLLSHIESVGTEVVLIDLSAVLLKDAAAIASEMVKTIRAVQLSGAQCVLTGIHPSLAKAMEPLVPDVNSIKTFRTMHLGLEAALGIIGIDIHKKK